MFLGPNGRRLLDPVQSYCRRAMTVATCAFFFFLLAQTSVYSASPGHRRTVVEVEGGPDGVVWIVQLSDLHFSVFHPDRALDFRRLIGPALSMINPSLVLITGDLTDGKSKDLLTMKQEEAEWIEYQNVTEDVIMRSGLDKNVFYDLRGNHDSFGVPEVGGEKDLYRKYSINGRLRRDENVQSVTLKHMGRKHVFVGIDTFMEIGLRGPTNLFGHPTDELLSDLDVELGQWDASFKETVKIAFGHFPLSFTTTTATGKNIKDVFLKHSLSAYLCGHLHTRFGKNLKRHHVESTGTYFQFNMHQENPNDKNNGNCSANAESSKEFWEWEMGDWRKSRSMRIVAIDSGHVSFLDLNFQLGSMDTIILPTFPLDSRFMHRISSLHDFPCRLADTSSLETVRALIFSRRLIVSVSLKIYDSRSGHFHLVLDQEMIKLKKGNKTRGDMYVAPWNWRAFTDPSPDRFLMQIEATDVSGKYTYSQPRPFSINGLTADTNWKWKEFFVMGVQWGALYYPLLHIVLTLLFTLLLIPRVFLHFSKSYTAYNKNNPAGSRGKSFFVGFVDTGFFILVELCRLAEIWWGILFYLIYLMFLPWFFGYVSVEDGEMSYMSRRGWSVSSSRNGSRNDYVGVPDIMVIVLPHLGFVVVPTVLVVGALAAERTAYRAHIHSLSGKKEDDDYKESKRYVKFRRFSDAFGFWSGRWIRKLLLFICLLILWKHWKQCRALVKAYDMNPFLHSPVFCFWIPLLIAYTIYKTSSVK